MQDWKTYQCFKSEIHILFHILLFICSYLLMDSDDEEDEEDADSQEHLRRKEVENTHFNKIRD